ncbi:phosphotransferase [Niallia sp. 03133]|uniref:phosphotransferase n=1 Tax=Niallia sp. 03133 TaxID=3458060 RepID=UPI0040442CAA
MKVVTMEINKKGDDYFFYRLLSLLKKQIPYTIKDIISIQADVYLIKTDHLWFIIKKYSSYQKLKIQEAFTNSLLKEGFTRTYRFYLFHEEPIILDRQIFGCIEYIDPHNQVFSYDSKANRMEALHVLNTYYETTAKLVDRYKHILPNHQMIEKWQARSAQFKSNTSIVCYYLDEQLINTLTYWADWSLEYLQKERHFFEHDESVILHGDVAHHNFLRGKNELLYLIDFDLISIGPKSVDYVQFANRILPLINWSFYHLEKIAVFQPLIKNKSFLTALAFPSDLFREWNRLIRQNNQTNTRMVHHLIKLTTNQFSKRRKFIQKIMKTVEKME